MSNEEVSSGAKKRKKNNLQVEKAETLPLSWVRKVSVCNVKIGGENIITRIADCVDILRTGISELRSDILKLSQNPFVGIDVVNNGDLLVFYIQGRCLIVQFNHIIALENFEGWQLHTLADFVQDKKITYVGLKNINTKSLSYSMLGGLQGSVDLKNVMDISCIEEVGLVGGIDVNNKPITSNGAIRSNWSSSSVLSIEEVQYAIYGAYSCYQIASKVFDVNAEGCRLSYLYKMSLRDVKMAGATFKTRVVDSVALLNLGLFELKGELIKYPKPVVGIDIVNGDLILLHGNNQCLIIQLKETGIPQSLLGVLENRSVTFVGPRNIRQKFAFEIKLGSYSIVDIGYFAAKFLMKPKLLSGTLEEVMAETGVDIKKHIIRKGENRGNPLVLSDEEVKIALYEVYSCYQIVNKLTEKIGKSMHE